MSKAMVLDQGKTGSVPANWKETISEDDSFNLYVDGKRIACVTTTEEGNIILVSSYNKVELIPFLTDEGKERI